MEIRLVDPADDAAIGRAHALQEAVRAFDFPQLAPESRRAFAGFLTLPSPGSQSRCYLAEAGGVVLGALVVHLLDKENAHYAECELAVHPDHRGRGVGTALHDHLLEVARDEGRSELVVVGRVAVAGGPSRSDAGVRFLERRGFTSALVEVERRLELAGIDPDAEERLRREAAAAAADYDLVSWVGRCPEPYLEGLGRIDSSIFAEIPLGDVDLRPRTIDAAYIRAREERAEAAGNAIIRTIAVPKGTKDVAANTLIYAPEGQTDARQAITIVDPAHRGHRLGLLVKLANLRQLREHVPEVTRVWTGNADTNANMVAINDLLGFRPVDAQVCYKRRLDI
jgi:GNAT superfamily N-acetyltransferase